MGSGMEPYRSSALRCPTCTSEAPLREYQGRLVCDECQGILLAEADLERACNDMTTQALTLSCGEAAAADSTCPRCERALRRVEVKLSPSKVRFEALRCERDGLWLRGGRLSEVLARVGHAFWNSKRGGESYGLSNTLVISERNRRRRPRPPTMTPVNLYGDRTLACPACAGSALRFVGDRYVCPTCEGSFVQTAALEALVMDMSGQPWRMPVTTGTSGTRACPVCTKAMIVEDLEGVPIDRCDRDGVWFDAVELTVALERASGQFEPRGMRAWLGKLFSRRGT